MSSKTFNSFLFSPGSEPNGYSLPVESDTDDSTEVRSRPLRRRSMRNPSRRFTAKLVSFQGTSTGLKVHISNNSFREPVICPQIYALATLGRGEANHEIKGSTREELRDSLRLALQQMPG